MYKDLDVIFPIGKEHQFIEAALQSIRESSKINLRIIFVDNTINGLKNVDRLINKNDIFIREPVRGFARALNAPLNESIDWSPFITVVNSDDLVDPSKFSLQIEGIETTNSDISITKLKKIMNGKELGHTFGQPSLLEYHPIFLLFGSYGADATVLGTSKWWKQNARRSEEVDGDLVDFENAIRTYPLTKIHSIAKNLYIYRQNEHQMSKKRASIGDFLRLRNQLSDFLRIYELEQASVETLFSIRPNRVYPLGINPKERVAANLLMREILTKASSDLALTEVIQHDIQVLMTKRELNISNFGSLKLILENLLKK